MATTPFRPNSDVERRCPAALYKLAPPPQSFWHNTTQPPADAHTSVQPLRVMPYAMFVGAHYVRTLAGCVRAPSRAKRNSQTAQSSTYTRARSCVHIRTYVRMYICPDRPSCMCILKSMVEAVDGVVGLPASAPTPWWPLCRFFWARGPIRDFSEDFHVQTNCPLLAQLLEGPGEARTHCAKMRMSAHACACMRTETHASGADPSATGTCPREPCLTKLSLKVQSLLVWQPPVTRTHARTYIRTYVRAHAHTRLHARSHVTRAHT